MPTEEKPTPAVPPPPEPPPPPSPGPPLGDPARELQLEQMEQAEEESIEL
jgi:hypothetical protein